MNNETHLYASTRCWRFADGGATPVVSDLTVNALEKRKLIRFTNATRDYRGTMHPTAAGRKVVEAMN